MSQFDKVSLKPIFKDCLIQILIMFVEIIIIIIVNIMQNVSNHI